MEKVKITREQEEALNIYRVTENGNIDHFMRRRHTWTGTYKSILSFTPQQFSFLLSGWYEVEQPYRIGDWLYNKENKGYRKVVEVEEYSRDVPYWFVIQNIEQYEKVTEPWKIMLLDEGREKPEFKIGDIYLTIHGNVNVIKKDTRIEDIEKVVSTGRIKKFYPVEKGIEVKAW